MTKQLTWDSKPNPVSKKGEVLTRVKLPSNGDAPDFRVTEAQQEGPVRLVDEQVVGLLLVHETQDSPGRVVHGASLLGRQAPFTEPSTHSRPPGS